MSLTTAILTPRASIEVLQHLSRVWVGPCRSEGAVALPDREHQLVVEASSAQLEQRER
jgi:hypothetical protein